MRTFEAMLITIISISVIGAYAHDTRSPIDLEPIDDWCNLTFDPITQLIEWSCHEIYEVPEELGLIEPKVPDLPEDVVSTMADQKPKKFTIRFVKRLIAVTGPRLIDCLSHLK